tara:strand:+ start:131 stop:295 length:165 start_codon:yes stop_codon:yes gene_type:complete
MIITAMDIFYICMIAVIFGFIIHLEAQVSTIKTMIEHSISRGQKMKDIGKNKKK